MGSDRYALIIITTGPPVSLLWVLVPAFPCVCRHHRYHHHLCQHHQWQHPSSHRSKQDCCRCCCGPPPRRRDRCCDCWCCCGGGCLPCCSRLPFVRLGYAFLLDPLIYKPTCLGRLRDHRRFSRLPAHLSHWMISFCSLSMRWFNVLLQFEHIGERHKGMPGVRSQ